MVINNKNAIPEGAFYSSCEKGILNAGKRFPRKPTHMDKYYYGDYIYTYYNGNKGWGVEINLNVTNKNRSEYGPILDMVGTTPVVSMCSTFKDCECLINPPIIPPYITDMDSSFLGCDSLIVAPVIPFGVINMDYCFYDCFSLEKSPVIPNSVKQASYIFANCKSLKRVHPIHYQSSMIACDMFQNCELEEIPVGNIVNSMFCDTSFNLEGNSIFINSWGNMEYENFKECKTYRVDREYTIAELKRINAEVRKQDKPG